MKIKYIDGESWAWLNAFSCEIKKIEEPFKGTVSIIKDATVKYPLTVDYEKSSKILFDDGYKCVVFVPDEGYWAASAVYDRNDDIVEWYFDVLRRKGTTEDGRLYFYDLYLDVVVRPDFEVVLIDEEDLEEALNDGIISKEDFDFAYKIAKELITEVTQDKSFLVTFLRSHLA